MTITKLTVGSNYGLTGRDQTGADFGFTPSGLTTEVVQSDKIIIHREYSTDKTLGANTEETAGRGSVSLTTSATLRGSLDNSLLKRAADIIESFKAEDPISAVNDLESLRGIILQLWENAAEATQYHQEILSLLESAMLSVEHPSEGMLRCFREAILDLQNTVLSQANVDVIRRQFIRQGFSPLALLSDSEDMDGDDNDDNHGK